MSNAKRAAFDEKAREIVKAALAAPGGPDYVPRIAAALREVREQTIEDAVAECVNQGADMPQRSDYWRGWADGAEMCALRIGRLEQQRGRGREVKVKVCMSIHDGSLEIWVKWGQLWYVWADKSSHPFMSTCCTPKYSWRVVLGDL